MEPNLKIHTPANFKKPLFHDVEQSEQIIEYMREYLKNPVGFIVFQGPNGRGKTYAARRLMGEIQAAGMPDMLLVSQNDMNCEWSELMKEYGYANYYKERLIEAKVLMIDDLGIKDPSPGFLDFLCSVIDKRYANRNSTGTILTTNLSSNDIASKFGGAFFSRALSGVVILCHGPEDRRMRNVKYIS